SPAWPRTRRATSPAIPWSWTEAGEPSDHQILGPVRRADRAGERGPRGNADRGAAVSQRASDRSLPDREGRRPAHGRARVLLPVDGRAPLPAGRLRGAAQPGAALALARDPDPSPEARLRVQHPAHVASGATGRG